MCNTPGGHSGVLEQGIFFEIPSVAINFPEYLEEALNIKNVVLSSNEEFEDNLKKLLSSLPYERVIKAKDKIAYSVKNVSVLLNVEFER